MNNLPAKRQQLDAIKRELHETVQGRLDALESHTKRSYTRGLDQFEEWLKLHWGHGGSTVDFLKDLTEREGHKVVGIYLEHLLYGKEPYARATVESRLAALKWVTRQAYDLELMPWKLSLRMPKGKRDPKSGKGLEKKGRDMRGPTPQEARDMERACETPLELLLFRLCRYEGYRIGEIRQFDYESFEGRWVTFRRKKRDKDDRLQISPSTYKALLAFLKVRGRRKGPLFPGRRGRLSIRKMRTMIVEIGERAGVPKMSPHRIRHRACTDIVKFCVKKGINEFEMLKLTGHSSLRALQPYYEYAREESEVDVLAGVNNMYDENGKLKL